MSVFLRWGIFGILAVAALVYAYNASKSMADKRAAKAGVAVSNAAPAESDDDDDDDAETAEPAPDAAAAPASPSESSPPRDCEAEFVVAQRALEARRQSEPFDRLLRIQEIAWQEPAARRHRLANVARRWYDLEGEEPAADALRIAVTSECEKFSPAP